MTVNKYGPNVQRLIIEFLAREVVPPGGGVENVLEFFQDPVRRKNALEQAENKALAYLIAIQHAPDNTMGDDLEEIAGVLLEKLKERRKAQRGKIHPLT